MAGSRRGAWAFYEIMPDIADAVNLRLGPEADFEWALTGCDAFDGQVGRAVLTADEVTEMARQRWVVDGSYYHKARRRCGLARLTRNDRMALGPSMRMRQLPPVQLHGNALRESDPLIGCFGA